MIRGQKPGIKILMVVLGALLLLTPFTGCAAEAPGKKPIVFVDGGWDSIHVHNRIAAFIVEHGYGYPKSEYITGGTVGVWPALARGDLDVDIETWTISHKEALEKALAAGEAVDVGTNFVDSWQGWLVPYYVVKGDPERGIEPMAPDLKSVFDMPKYWELFKDPEDPTKGVFISGIPGWQCEKINTEKFEAYGLYDTYNIFCCGSGAALTASMFGAYEKGEPWIGYYWEPTWPMEKLDMIKLEEPPYDEEVWDATRGCAYPPEPTHVVVTPGLLDRAPEVVEFFRNYETTCDQNNKFLNYMNVNDASAEEAAIWFLKKYESTWTKWVSSDVASKVKAALP